MKLVHGGWTEDYKKFLLYSSRFVANQLAVSVRDDVTQCAPALLVFRLMIATCAAGLLGVNACFPIYDISVELLHSRMDEVVLVVKLEFCWRL